MATAADGSEEDLPGLLHELLAGEGGLATQEGVTHRELVRATCDLVARVLHFDECWLQPPDAFAAQAARWAANDRGAWTTNPAVADARGSRSGLGALGVVPVVVDGEAAGALVVWSASPRAWSSRDRRALRAAAGELSRVLAATAAWQVTDRERAARELEELRGELITTLNHELRTPLTTLVGGLDLLLDGAMGDLEPAQLRLVERLERSVLRLQELAQNVSRLTADPVDPRRWDHDGSLPATDAFALARTCLDELGITGRDLEVDVAEPDEPLLVQMPVPEVRELLDRVLTNAVKFTPDGGRISVRPGLVTGRAVELVVVDTGVGVPREEQAGLGSTFFRSSTSRREEKQGSGLGLAAARRLLEAWGGSLDLTATEGVGTHVCLTLPRVRGEREAC